MPRAGSDPDTSPGPGWSRPLPQATTRPTWWPAALALGITVTGWGALTSPLVAVVGAAVLLLSLGGWIGEILDAD